MNLGNIYDTSKSYVQDQLREADHQHAVDGVITHDEMILLGSMLASIILLALVLFVASSIVQLFS